MYDSHNLAIKIKSVAKERKIVIKDMLVDCELGCNTMSAMYHGKSIAYDSLAKIADYLDCSIDYLTGRTNDPDSHKGKHISKINVEKLCKLLNCHLADITDYITDEN